MTGKTIDEEVVGDRAELTCAINADLVASFVTISVTATRFIATLSSRHRPHSASPSLPVS